MTIPLRIVVADDEEDMRDYFRRILSRLGHEVVGAAATGRELIELCRQHAPDLVITDIRMPGMDGAAAAEKIVRECCIPAILVSAYPTPSPETHHILRYLIKPIRQAELKAAIDSAIEWIEQFQMIRGQADNPQQASENLKVITQAKALIMKVTGVDDHSAFQRLRDLALAKNGKLAEMAQGVLTAGEGFNSLEV